MAKTLIGALALASLPSALAFSNTSPFFLFSTADLLIPSADASIADSSAVTADVLSALKDCPTRNYVVVEQQGVASADYADARMTPRLAHYMTAQQAGVRSTFSVPEIVGQIDVDALTLHLKTNCAPSDPDQAWYALLKAPAPHTSKALREADLKEQDDTLEEFVADKMGGRDYTVIYTTAPQTESQAKSQIEEEQHTYEMEPPYGEAVQMELKRDTSAHYAKRANSTSEGGLFERYQYFTPGLFMGFAAIIPLFLILLVGIKALVSLEVSYFAFSKEMGPNAQKKQQQ